MKIKDLKYIALAGVLAMSMASCDDFLDKVP